MSERLSISLMLFVYLSVLAGCHSSNDSSNTAPASQPPPSDSADPFDQLWQTEGFGLAAADEVQDGIYIATDYVFDDRGANTDGVPGGDFTYPADDAPYKRNASDLVELRLMPDAGDSSIWLGIRLNTLIEENIPVVAVGIDDGSAEGLAVQWPFDAGVHASGVRYVLTLTGEKAMLTDLENSDTRDFPVNVGNDLGPEHAYQENTLTVKLPASAFNLSDLPDGVWRAYAMSGLWEGGSWAAPASDTAPGYDVGFIEEEFVNWQQNRQADVLASGDLSGAAVTIDFREFPDRPAPARTGLQTRIYRSPISHLVGEGIASWDYRVSDDVQAPSGSNHYQGLYLPYLLWVPPQLAQMNPPYPVFTLLHGLTQDHLSVAAPFLGGVMTHPGLTVMPTGAGESSFYKAEGEIDLLVILQDLKAHYPTDEDRIYLSGLSMGGQGVYSFAVHHPDLFAAAIPLIGTGQALFHRDAPVDLIGEQRFTTERFQNSNGRELMENAFNLPIRQINGAQDPIVNPTWPIQDAERAMELGNDYQLTMFTNRGHEVVFEHLNAVFHQVLSVCQTPTAPPGCAKDHETMPLVRDENPARVVYKVTPHQFFPDIGIFYEGAYWVSGLIVRDLENPGDSGLIDVTSYGLGHKLKGDTVAIEPVLEHFAPTGDDYVRRGQRQALSTKNFEPRMDVYLENLSDATIDLARANLAETSEQVTIAVETDGNSLLTFTQVGSGTNVLLDNNFVMNVGADGVAEVALGAGNHTVTLSP